VKGTQVSDNEETFGFTSDFQKGIVVMMLFDKTFFPLIATAVKPKHFDSPILKDLAVTIIDFVKKYDRTPTVIPESTEFWELFDTFLGTKRFSREKVDEYSDVVIEIIKMGKEEKIDFAYYRDKVVAFAQYQDVKEAMRTAGEKHLPHGDYGKIVTDVQKAMMIGASLEDLGTDVYEDLEKDLEERHTTLDRSIRGIPTGISQIDYYLGGIEGDPGRQGGICPQETGVIMAFTKGGKTTIAANFTREALNQGIDVVHYSFEGGGAAAKELYHAMISGVDKRQLDKQRIEVKEKYDEFFGRDGIGRLRIKHFLVGSTVRDLESHLHQLKIQKGIDPGLLIIDYIGLMKPADRSVKYKERYDLFGQIVLEIISLAQRGNYAIWALHQSTRASKGKKIIRIDDVADSMDVMRHVDLILTLNQTKEEEESRPEIMRIYAAGGRNVEDKWTVKVEYDRFRAQIRELKTEAK